LIVACPWILAGIHLSDFAYPSPSMREGRVRLIFR